MINTERMFEKREEAELMLIQENLSIEEKLRILSDAAKYDAPAHPAAW